MAAVKSALKSIAEPLIAVGLRSVLSIPVEGAIDWVKQRFTDHSEALPKAIAAANDRAWQALALALAGDSLLDTIFGRFRDSDMKAVRAQIRAFVDNSDSGLELSPAGLRVKACEELNQLRRAGRLGADVEWTALDLTRFGSTAKLSDDAHRAVSQIAAELQADAPHLFQVLTLAPPGGTPLLATAFAFFLRRQIATNPELAVELTHDSLRLLSQKQQAGFENLEHSLDSKWSELGEMLSSMFADNQNNQSEIIAKLDRILEQNQVVTKPESPLRVSVNSESERDLVRQLRDRVRELPTELVGAKLHSLLGDGLAAAGEFADAQQSHAAAAVAAHASADRTAEAEAEYKQFKDACEIQKWEPALAALNRAIALDEKRFRPVPKHYAIESILGAGAFGVVFKCRNTISYDEDDNELIVAVKTFRESDLDRPSKTIFSEANILKNLTHENIIRVIEHNYADPDTLMRPFLAMEYFSGVTLEEHLRQHGKLSVENFFKLFTQIASALHAAHSGKRPVFHRDLKPANIMVRKDGEIWTVKVIDFGLAIHTSVRKESVNLSHALRVTRDKCIAGTIKYAAPEQLGEKPYIVGAHSDVFAFGKTALDSLFATVQPTARHWKSLPDCLADMLARCVEEEYFPKQPDEGRFHGFSPILVSLAQSVAPATAKPIVKSVPAPAVIKPVEPIVNSVPIALTPLVSKPSLSNVASETRPVPSRVTIPAKPVEPNVKSVLVTLSPVETKPSLPSISKEMQTAPAVAKPVGTIAISAPAKETRLPKVRLFTIAKDLDIAVSVLVTHCKHLGFSQVKNQFSALNGDQVEAVKQRIAQSTKAAITSATTQKLLNAGDRLDIPFPGGLKMAFAYCPSGSFMMGSPVTEQERDDNETQHKVTLSSSYYMGIHPVTRGQFAVFIAKSNYKTEAEMHGGGHVWNGKEWVLDPKFNWRNPGFAQTDDHPVCFVSYKDAVSFSKWLINHRINRILFAYPPRPSGSTQPVAERAHHITLAAN